jgi:cation diffusion facilitator CzcD-associated flavoprotein CzcO
MTAAAPHHFDAIIIGAGMSGLYQLHRLRVLGLSARVFEAGSDVGGVWYWNRYPGARFDSESYSYGYSFDESLLKDWSWSEHFAAQPETLAYLTHVADRLDLRRDITFGARIKAARFDAKAALWTVTLEDASQAFARFLITAVGPLSATVMPSYPGMDSFRGQAFHTSLWPHEPVDFAGKRVAVIGTGSTGVQTIQEVAKTAAQLTVFQRSPNWCAPLHNRPISPDEQVEIKATYPQIFERCARTNGGFLYKADGRLAMEVSPEEREAFYEELYAAPGFRKWVGNFRDTMTDAAANATISDFIARKIRRRVTDPKVAEKLIPRDHGFGTRRVPLETHYYEVYNQPNVELIDLNQTPITAIIETGLRTSARDFEFDLIVYATGFDAIVGSLNRIDIRGPDATALRDKWAKGGVSTFLGLAVHGFPNLFTIVGPQNAGTVCNMPRCIEQNVDWITALITHMTHAGLTTVEAEAKAQRDWVAHTLEMTKVSLMGSVDSWFTGVNKNIPGREKRQSLVYAGGALLYKKTCDEVAAQGYAGMRFG